MEDSYYDQRRHRRTEFAYPVDIKILGQNAEAISLSGYIENISVSGAGIVFEDKYGRVEMAKLQHEKIKLAAMMPTGEKVTLLANIRWVNRDPEQKLNIRMGLEFESVEDWQLELIKKLIHLKHKDHNMMWNLWEHYENQS